MMYTKESGENESRQVFRSMKTVSTLKPRVWNQTLTLFAQFCFSQGRSEHWGLSYPVLFLSSASQTHQPQQLAKKHLAPNMNSCMHELICYVFKFLHFCSTMLNSHTTQPNNVFLPLSCKSQILLVYQYQCLIINDTNSKRIVQGALNKLMPQSVIWENLKTTG